MAVGKNNIGVAFLFGLVLVAPSAPKYLLVAATMGFFLDNWRPKSWVAPDRMDIGAPKTGDVTVSIDATDVITKIPPSIYGHNANTWMSAMITEPVFMQHLSDLRPHVIRWPAGSGSDGYWWDRAPGDLPADVPRMLLDENGKKKYTNYFWAARRAAIARRWTAIMRCGGRRAMRV